MIGAFFPVPLPTDQIGPWYFTIIPYIFVKYSALNLLEPSVKLYLPLSIFWKHFSYRLRLRK